MIGRGTLAAICRSWKFQLLIEMQIPIFERVRVDMRTFVVSQQSKILAILICLLINFNLDSSLVGQSAQDDLPTKRNGSTPVIFDGKTLDNWMFQNGKAVTSGWEVVNGEIHRKPNKKRVGNIVTKDKFGDFDLSFEWKIARNGNSGLKYRVKKYGRKMLGCEYQIFDQGNTGDVPGRKSTAALYDLFEPDPSRQLKPIGQFNQSRVVVRGDRIEHWLNGNLVVSATVGNSSWTARIKESKFNDVPDFGRNQRGRIMLTDHGAEVWFRHFKISQPVGSETESNGKKSSKGVETFSPESSPKVTEIPRDSVNNNRSRNPNVVLIYIDDLGYGDLGCFGCQDIPTPNIDRLAKEGVRLTASHITNPPCCPSRCGLMMGQYAQRFGKYGMSRGLPIPEDRPTMAKFLSDRGYATGHIGKWDIGTKRQGPLQVGFTEVAKIPPKKTYTPQELAQLPNALQKQLAKRNGKSKYLCKNKLGETKWLTDYDGDSIVNFVERHQAEPFFLYWSPEAVHSFNLEAPLRLMERTQAEGKRRSLAGAIVSVDDQVGKLLSALNKFGLRENTLVIFTSDNGADGDAGGTSVPYAGGKGQGTQKEGWVRVPTIFSMPGTIPLGKDYDGLIANFDFYSTIAATSGHAIPSHCDGVNLLPLLKGNQTGDAHEYLFWLNNEPGDAVHRHLIAVRWKNWRLYRKYKKDPWQLFDLKADPQEKNDLAVSYPEVVKTLAAKHAAWEKTLAPLGVIPDIRGGLKIPTGNGWSFHSVQGETK